MATPSHLLEIQDLTVSFDTGQSGAHCAIDQVSLSIREGEAVALVGESGSGKTVLAHSILGLLPKGAEIPSGRVLWQGRNLLDLKEAEFRQIRGRQIAMVFQDAQASLNPVYSIRDQFRWVLKLHRGMKATDADAESERLLGSVQLNDQSRVLSCYPHQLSGGMCQRIMIALALACAPRMIIADEPTSALDRIVQNEIVELLDSIHSQTGMSMLVITHDLGMARRLATRVAVIQEGAIVEEGLTEQIFEKPDRKYTKRLIAAAEFAPTTI